MAPKGKKRQSSTYDSDNGFVANDSGNEGTATHRAKKARTTKSKPDTSSSSFKSASKAAGATGEEKKVDSNGDPYWELSRLRRVTVSSFKGRTLVNVREYYEKDGQELPGKKGISMPIDQFSSMIKLLPNIEAAVKEKGETLPRPEYVMSGGKDEDEEEEQEEGDDAKDENQLESASEEEEEEEVKPRSKKDKKSKKNGVRKKNIEATSDEDESE